MKRKLNLIFLTVVAMLVAVDPALAEPASSGASYAALGAGMAIGLGALGGTIGQSIAVNAALTSIGRNPAAGGKVFTPMIIGLALIESLVILSFVIAFFLLG